MEHLQGNFFANNEFLMSDENDNTKINDGILKESIDLLRDGSGKRIYVLTKMGELIGVFSNRKPLLAAMISIGIEDCYIKGSRLNKKVTVSSVASGFENGVLRVYKKDEEDEKEQLFMKTWEINMNRINPNYFKEFTN